ncbi:Ltp family lipoprotein [Microbacterium jejuense]|uniref:Ltp family lipoprotein n=1 Tax=Microbacterium jejuense TaxID=1263637 RepID=A0ABS7HQY0_9MICO|nr:Ltp family lipoprotein [Microbacterium jejuense]MBW9094434.1 Ltp family lipoprotein [Microbacterium jejuense]
MSENNNTAPQLPPAGWYPDPHNAGGQRYWDGAQWTEHVAVPSPDGVAVGAGAPEQTVAVGGGGAVAVSTGFRMPPLKWWLWALIAFGVLLVISVIVGSLSVGRDDAARTEVTPTATSPAREVDPPAAAPVDDREAMPGLVGHTVAEARAAVEAAGFTIDMPVDTGDDWIVLTQTISEGRQADAGTAVFITAEAPKPVYTLAQQNAIDEARSYLAYSGFSRTGLIGQLEYEGYSTEDATFGADNAGADWNAECAESAASYLEYSSFSRQGLYDQLAYEGFTDAEIQFGLAAVGY